MRVGGVLSPISRLHRGNNSQIIGILDNFSSTEKSCFETFLASNSYYETTSICQHTPYLLILLTFDLFFNKPAPCAARFHHRSQKKRGEGPFPLKHTTPRPVFSLSLFSHTFIYAFSEGGAGCRLERSEHCLLLGVGYPMATSSTHFPFPFLFLVVCIYTWYFQWVQ